MGGGLIRLIIILVIAWLVYSLTRRWLATLQNKSETKKEHIESMTRCDHCGLHIPQNEAIQSQGKTYCSDEHKKLAEK
ncbi:MAG: PP0621 family protein [Gammaproteobacteria bacterium]|nr:PP0621 family protein [Gammaproteobacteria bacterium]